MTRARKDNKYAHGHASVTTVRAGPREEGFVRLVQDDRRGEGGEGERRAR